MKAISPLLSLFFGASIAHGGEWVSLSGIADKVDLAAGETALVVSVSEPSHVLIDKPGSERLRLRMRPDHDHDHHFAVNGKIVGKSEVLVSWDEPFAVAGPCTITLRSTSLMTLRTFSAASAASGPMAAR